MMNKQKSCSSKPTECPHTCVLCGLLSLSSLRFVFIFFYFFIIFFICYCGQIKTARCMGASLPAPWPGAGLFRRVLKSGENCS